MIYRISANDTPQIDFAPATVAEEVMQNVRTIISTMKYDVPLDRAFGINGDVVDLPLPVAQAKLTSEIFTAIKRYEPRAVIEGINFTADLNGRLVPTVEVSINA